MRVQTKKAQSNTTERLSIGIVGGGIGGIALAIALSRCADLDLHLFEAASKFSEIGAGVSFGPNAVAAIRHLGLDTAYQSVADGSPAPYEDVWFEWRRMEDEAYLTSSIALECGQSSVHRADFLDAMVNCLPESIAQFGKRCCGILQDDEGVHVFFEDGSQFTGDVVIGADGIKSAVREHVLPSADYGDVGPRSSGTHAYRGLVEREELANCLEHAGVDPRLAHVPQMYLGIDRHVLTFPIKQGEIVNVVAFVSDRSRPGPKSAETGTWVTDVTQAEMRAVFSGCGSAVKTVLDCIESPTRWSLHDIPTLPHYHRHRVLLMGDSAHAMLPHQGAGAGQALEDAYELSRLLGNARCKRRNVADVLAAFDAVRRSRAGRVQATSFAAGELYQCRAPGITDDEGRLADELEHRFDWIWQFDPRQSVAEASTLLSWS